MKVVLISAKARNGKDQSAIYLKEILEEKGKRILIIHYADYLKYFCKEYLGWDGIKDEHGREILQKWGSQVVRKNYSDTWVDIIIAILRGIYTEYDYVLIPDVRFPNEIDKMKENFDCISIRLTRPNFDNGLTSEQKEHISETALDNYIGFNCRIINDGSLSELKQMLKNFTKRELGV